MDIVYPLIATKDDNTELRYSLRSLKNINHWNIFVVWHKPKRIQNVNHIEYVDNNPIKVMNVIEKLKIVCNDDRISDDFILMNDDFFILEPTEIQYYHQWTISDHILRRQDEWLWFSNYFEWIVKTQSHFENGLDYELHIPFIYNKKKLLNLFEKYDFSDWLLIRNMYWNEYKVWGKFIEDVKHRNWKWFIKEENQIYISSNDKSLRDKKFSEFIYNWFSEPSCYESLFYIYNKMEKIKVLFLKSLSPYRKGEIGEIKAVAVERFEKMWYVERVSWDEENTPKKVSAKVVKQKVSAKKEKKVSAKKEKKVSAKENKSMQNKPKKNKSL